MISSVQRWKARARRVSALYDLRSAEAKLFHHSVELSHGDPTLADRCYELSEQLRVLVSDIASATGVRP